MQTPQSSVAILTPYLHHHKGHGGITPWLEELVAIYLNAGWKVTILVNAHQYVLEETPPLNKKATIATLGYHKIEAQKNLNQYIETQRCDILISAGHRYNNQALFAFNKIKTVKTKLIISVHENITEGSRRMGWFKKWLRYRIIRRFYPIADSIVCVSKGVAKDVQSIVGEKPQLPIQAIYNPLIGDAFYEKSELPIEGINKKLFDSPYILSTGRLSEQKNYSLLIDAFAHVSDKRSENLIILGEGDQRPLLEQKVKALQLENRVFLPGFVKNPLPLVKGAKLFALSSKWEGLSYSLIEAIALGVTCVSTDCPSGPSEVLDYGRCGYLADDYTAKNYAEKLLVGLDTPLPKDTLVEQAKVFSIDRVGEQFLSLSERLLKA